MQDTNHIFRGKRADNGKWVEGCLLRTNWPDMPEFIARSRAFIVPRNIADEGIWKYPGGFMFEVDTETIGIGFVLDTDKPPIFQGDILSVAYQDDSKEEYRFIVDFGPCGGTHNVNHDVGYIGLHVAPADENTMRAMSNGARDDILYWLNAYKDQAKIIGNIYDNPDLAEKE